MQNSGRDKVMGGWSRGRLLVWTHCSKMNTELKVHGPRCFWVLLKRRLSYSFHF